MKIMVFNGSPKGDASDTMHVTRAFLDGINEMKDHEIHILHVAKKHIEFCTGCLACMKNGGNCMHDDDMSDILSDMLEADMVIWSFPLYYYGMPAQLKAVIERMLPLNALAMQRVGDHYEHIVQKNISGLRHVMICGCGFPNSENNFEPAVMHFRRIFQGESTVITVAEAPMFNVPEAAAVTQPFLQVIRQAGREYGKSGVIEESTMEKIMTPMIPQDIYAQIVNSGV